MALIALLLLLLGASRPADAGYLGPPYYTNYIGGRFDTVQDGLDAMAAQWHISCPTCTFYYTYYSSPDTTNRASISPQRNTIAYTVYATYWPYDPKKQAGGCNPLNGGNGGQGASAPQGGSGDGAAERRMCPSSTFAGDPIDTATGNKYQQETDYRSTPLLTFRRFYNSTAQVPRANLGTRWRHSFNRALELYLPYVGSNSQDALITLERPDGSGETFVRKDGVWAPPSDSLNTLAEIKDINGTVSGYSLFMGGPRETETYSSGGKLVSITEQSGATTLLDYSTSSTPTTVASAVGLLVSVTDPEGRALHFAYDSAARLTQLTLPDGGTVTYTYDAVGNLVAAMLPDGGKRQYVYNETSFTGGVSLPNAMTGVIDEKGVRYETTTYNSDGKAVSSYFAGNVDTFTIDYSKATVTTPLGATTKLAFTDAVGRQKVSQSSTPCGIACNQPLAGQTFDVNGYPASTTDFNGVVSTTTYDAHGLLIRKVDASGTDAQRNTSATWDAGRRIPLTSAVSNAKGIVVAKNTWSYNTRGQVVAECTVDPSVTVTYTCGSQAHAPTGIRQTRYSYCDAIDTTQCPEVGLLLTVDGPRNDVTDLTRYAYYLTSDESGCGLPGGTCHRTGDLHIVLDANNHTTTVVAYDRAGRIVRSKDANGVLTDIGYTPRGWLSSRTVRSNADGTASAADATTVLTYEPTGALASVTDPDGVRLTYTYDDAHRLVDAADSSKAHIRYTLDVSGNPIKEETFDAAGISRRSSTRSYNALGQLITIKDGLGQVTFDATAPGSYDGNGNLLQSKDPFGIVRKDTYDALNRLTTSVANAGGIDPATRDTTISKVFDALDQIKSITDPDGLITSYGFDGLSNPNTLTSPDTGISKATFDAAGNALTRTDAKGTVATRTYDALGRVVSTSYPDASLNIAYHFDEANSVTGCQASFPVGRLTRIVETAVTTVYCYDNRGRVTEQRQTQGAATDTTDYVYTLAGRLAGIASPSGLVTEYARDTLGQITSVTVTPANGVATKVVTGATYLPFGPVASYTLGNGQTLTRTYDANYQVTDVVSPALALHFARDAAGNIKALGDAAGASPATETYTYDPLYRLTGVNDATGKVVEAYSYSKTGDRLIKMASGLAAGTYGYQKGTHWLASVGSASRSYDANGSTTGNATAGLVWGYGYNGRGQLISVQQGGAEEASYAYNALAQRIRKTVNGSSLRFSYSLSGELLTEYGTTSRDYVWLDEVPVALVDAGVAGDAVGYVHSDALGTPRVVTNATGLTRWSWSLMSNPFGEVAPVSANGYAMNLRYPGQYFDAESGLSYNHHRFYDSASGRYMQSDPLGLAAGINTYAYAGSGPMRFVDPLGLEQRLGYTSVMPGPGQNTNQNPWQIQWNLSEPSPAGGWIVQQNTITLPDGAETTYWEAWRVDQNSTVTAASASLIKSGFDPVDDTFEVQPASANIHFNASARFYEKLKLPCDFVPDSNPYAKALPATSINPHLPLDGATPAVVRSWSPH